MPPLTFFRDCSATVRVVNVEGRQQKLPVAPRVHLWVGFVANFEDAGLQARNTKARATTAHVDRGLST